MTHKTRQGWDYHQLRHSFPGADTLTYNYAQSDQDIWVLSMLNGKRNGTYLEIGAGWPEHISNTALLELQFGWHGVSIDYQDGFAEMWRQAGRRTFQQSNGENVDFDKLLAGFPPVIDYLTIDCEPSWRTFEILQRIPWSRYQFRVITFEHECYSEGPQIKQASREFLTTQGYCLAANNISHLGIATDYEDWWVRPELVDPDRLQLLQQVDDTVKDHKVYLYFRCFMKCGRINLSF